MAAACPSCLQKCLLKGWLNDDQRMNGGMSSRHQERGGALRGDKGHLSHRLHTLETGG